QKKLIMLPSETMIWQPEFTDKTLSRKPGAVQPDRKKILYVETQADSVNRPPLFQAECADKPLHPG
ncbi:hypothetical protein, partial [Escherichia coli]|uniref:hypothetical protein n=1 Tax=Escherichia coli TaxID=562 RepID=UPI001BDB8673